jgi:hypothetical protein
MRTCLLNPNIFIIYLKEFKELSLTGYSPLIQEGRVYFRRVRRSFMRRPEAPVEGLGEELSSINLNYI